MAGSTLHKQGGFSNLCLFHCGLGSNDEAAGLHERAEKILYYFPHDTPVHEQLKRVGYLEGLISFSKTFAPNKSVNSVRLNKRRYVFLEVEPQIWMVLALVREQLNATPGYARSTDSGEVAPQPTLSGGLFARAPDYTGPPVTPPPKETFYSSDGISDDTILSLMQRMYDGYVLFYGRFSRVLGHPDAMPMVDHVLQLRERLRKLQDKRESAEANAAFTLEQHELTRQTTDVTQDPADGPSTASDGGGGRVPSAPPRSPAASDREPGPTLSGAAQSQHQHHLESLSTEEYLVRCHLTAIDRYSPVSALRRCLRDFLDFCVYYTDWSNIGPFDGDANIRHMPLRRDLVQLVSLFVGKLTKGLPSLHHVSLFYDGFLVVGQDQPGLQTLYWYLRMHAFHSVRASQIQQLQQGGQVAASIPPEAVNTVLFEPDRRDFEFGAEECPPMYLLGGDGTTRSAGGNRLSLGRNYSTGSASATPEGPPRGMQSRIHSTANLAAMGSTGQSVSAASLSQRLREYDDSRGSSRRSSGVGAGVVHLIDGRRWAEAVDISSITLDLADRLATDPHKLSLVMRHFSGRTFGPLVTNAIEEAFQSLQSMPRPVAASLSPGAFPDSPAPPLPGSPWSHVNIDGGSSASTSSSAVVFGSSTAAAAGAIVKQIGSPSSEYSYSTVPSAANSPEPGSNRFSGRGAGGSSAAQQSTGTRPGGSGAQPKPGRQSLERGAGTRGGTASAKHPLHNAASKPASLSIPALPGAADSQRCLRGVVTVDPSWPVLALPYVAFAYLQSLRQLLAASKAADVSVVTEDSGALQLAPSPTSSNCMGPVFSMFSPREPGLGSPPNSPNPLPRSPDTGRSMASSTSAASNNAPAGEAMRRIGSAFPKVAASEPGGTVAGAVSGVAEDGDAPRIFTPPLFTGTRIGADALPDHRLLWVQQGLVTVLAYADASTLIEKQPMKQRFVEPVNGAATATGDAVDGVSRVQVSPAKQLQQASVSSRPLSDIDSRTILSLSRNMSQACEVYVATLEEALGDAFDSRAQRNLERGLDMARTFGVDAHEATIDVHGTRFGARRPGKSKSATGGLISQAVVVTSAQAAAELPHHLLPAMAHVSNLSAAYDGLQRGASASWASEELVQQLVISSHGVDKLPACDIRGTGHVEPCNAFGTLLADASGDDAPTAGDDTASSGADPASGETPSATTTAAAAPARQPPPSQARSLADSEVHILGTRSHGIISARRNGSKSAVLVFDGPAEAPSASSSAGSASDRRRRLPLDGHLDGDLAEVVARTKAAHKALFPSPAATARAAR